MGAASLSSPGPASPGKLTTLSSTTGAFKLAAMKRDPGSKNANGSRGSSAANSPRSDAATVWKKPEESKPVQLNVESIRREDQEQHQGRHQSVFHHAPYRQEENASRDRDEYSYRQEHAPHRNREHQHRSQEHAPYRNQEHAQFQDDSYHNGSSRRQEEQNPQSHPLPESKPSNVPEPPTRDMSNLSEEELTKQGIHLAHRLSAAELTKRKFNWDEDDDDDDWAQKLKGLVPEKKIPHPEPKSEPKTAPWAAVPKESHAVPIADQIRELSEMKQRRSQQQAQGRSTPHYNYYINDGPPGRRGHDPWERDEGADHRYRYHDYEHRYRPGNPPPRAELFNASNGQFEPVQDVGGSRRRGREIVAPGSEDRSISPRFPLRRVSIASEEARSSRSIERQPMSPAESPVEQASRKSISEEQKEIMRLAREKARKRKEEELQREKEKEEAAKKRAEEFARKMEEKHKAEREQQHQQHQQQQGQQEQPQSSAEPASLKVLSPKRNYRSYSNASIDEQTIKAVNSIIGDDHDELPEVDHGTVATPSTSRPATIKEHSKVDKLWGNQHHDTRSGTSSSGSSRLWNSTSHSDEGVWGNQMAGGIKGDTSSLFGEGAFLDRQRTRRGSTSRQIRSSVSPGGRRDCTHIWGSPPGHSNIDGESWRSGRSVTAPVSMPSSQILGHESPSGRNHSKFFPTVAQSEPDSKPGHIHKVGWSGAHSDGPDGIGQTPGGSSGGNDQRLPRVVLPPSGGGKSTGGNTREGNAYKKSSINSIEELQSTIVKKLGSTYSSNNNAPVLSLPVPRSPVVSRIPAEDDSKYHQDDLSPDSEREILELHALAGLKVQGDIIDSDHLFKALDINTTIKLGDYGKAMDVGGDTDDVLLQKVRIPGNDFSSSAYFKDSSGYTHRREFENPDALASYTTIHLPGTSRLTVHQGVVTSRPFGKALRADASKNAASHPPRTNTWWQLSPSTNRS